MSFGKQYRFSVHPAGFIGLAAAFLFLPSRTVLAATAALLLHEAGHMAALLLCGVRSWHFELTPFGGMADARTFDSLSPFGQVCSAGAGILVSLLGALGCMGLKLMHPFWYSFIQFQLSLAFVNCLPVWPLDGSRVLIAAASVFGKEETMKRALAIAAKGMGICFVLLGLWGVWHGECNWSLLASGPYLWYASQKGRVSENVRRMALAQNGKGSRKCILPLTAYACTEQADVRAFAYMLGRFSAERYHLLLQLNDMGQISRILTEDELSRLVFEDRKD